jgi:VanZ family protein
VAFAALGALSLWPGGIEARTGASGHLEHFAAYAFTGFLLTLAYAGFEARFAIFCLLGMYAAALERLQLAVPGRTSQLIDFEGSVAGAFAGFLAGLLFAAIGSRRRRQVVTMDPEA